MIVVHKFPLTSQVCDLQMPKGAKIIHAACQQDVPTIWAIVNPDEDMETRRIVGLGTGQPHTNGDDLTYIGTVHQFNGQLVWHIFEEQL